jgi:spore coat polysaccharide biosynthesis predicted glycosyltransferase SpsG
MPDAKKTSVRGRKKQAEELEKLRAEAEFLDRQDAENAIHTHLEWSQVDLVRRVAWVHADPGQGEKAHRRTAL